MDDDAFAWAAPDESVFYVPASDGMCCCDFCDEPAEIDGQCGFCFTFCPSPGDHGRFAESLAGILRWRAHQTRDWLIADGFDPIVGARQASVQAPLRRVRVTTVDSVEHVGRLRAVQHTHVVLDEIATLHGDRYIALDDVASVVGIPELRLALEARELDRAFHAALRRDE